MPALKRRFILPDVDTESDMLGRYVVVVIRGEMAMRGLHADDLAGPGLTRQTVGRLLRGQRPMRLDYLAQIATVFGWTPAELMRAAEERMIRDGHHVPGGNGANASGL